MHAYVITLGNSKERISCFLTRYTFFGSLKVILWNRVEINTFSNMAVNTSLEVHLLENLQVLTAGSNTFKCFPHPLPALCITLD